MESIVCECYGNRELYDTNDVRDPDPNRRVFPLSKLPGNVVYFRLCNGSLKCKLQYGSQKMHAYACIFPRLFHICVENSSAFRHLERTKN